MNLFNRTLAFRYLAASALGLNVASAPEPAAKEERFEIARSRSAIIKSTAACPLNTSGKAEDGSVTSLKGTCPNKSRITNIE